MGISNGFMDEALKEAHDAEKNGEVPIGAVMVKNGEIIARAGNRILVDRDPTAHAEILVIRSATRLLGSERIPECDLYVTLEPCAMCACAISFARIRRLYYGAGDEKGGAVDHGVRLFHSPSCNHKPEVYSGFAEKESSLLLKGFFAQKRTKNGN